MELFKRFKKDYLNYLVSTILPAIISGISIPLFKRILGAEGYGHFALWINAILILSAVLMGWCAQSIIRFFPVSNDKRDFSQKSLRLSLKVLLFFTIPLALITWFISKDAVLVFICTIALFSNSVQLVMLPVIQASFLSRKVIYSELIRILIYVGGGITLLLTTNVFYLYSLIATFALSYFFSFVYLYSRSKKEFNKTIQNVNPKNTSELIRKFYHYGIPISFWFVFSYLLTYLDKLFSFHFLGANFQGNYQAIFDFINKSLTLLIAPVIAALFPLLTSAYETGNKSDARKLIKKILLYELSGFILASIAYWIFGANLLLLILKIPETQVYKNIGFIIICGTFIWQFAILAQKRYELNIRTHVLLGMVIIAFISQLSIYYFYRFSQNEYIAPVGFLTAATIYLILVSLPEIINIFKTLKRKINQPGNLQQYLNNE